MPISIRTLFFILHFLQENENMENLYAGFSGEGASAYMLENSWAFFSFDKFFFSIGCLLLKLHLPEWWWNKKDVLSTCS